MKTVTALQNQSIFDIAIQHCGSVEAAYSLAQINGLPIDAELHPGQELLVPSIQDRVIVTTLAQRNVTPATAYSLPVEDDPIPPIPDQDVEPEPEPEPYTASYFGLLYNQLAVVDERKIASSDTWYVPSKDNYMAIRDYINQQIAFGNLPNVGAGSILKSARTEPGDPLVGEPVETDPRWGHHATNYGRDNLGAKFEAAGYRDEQGGFGSKKFWSFTWTSDAGVAFTLLSILSSMTYAVGLSQLLGCNLRLFRAAGADAAKPDGTRCANYVQNDGTEIKTVKIGQFVITDALQETQFRNGDKIAIVEEAATWAKGSFDNWFLPSPEQLQAIRENLVITDKVPYTGWVWSSLNDDHENAVIISIITGAAQLENKFEPHTVIPCRSFTSTFERTVGERGEAGWIFSKSGNTYLEAADPDHVVPNLEFGLWDVDVEGTQDGSTTGGANTALIVAALEANNESGKAAQYCNDLIVGSDSQTFSDWHLPSLDELVELMEQIDQYDLGGFDNVNYHSSSEKNATESWGYNRYPIGEVITIVKPLTGAVRPIRRFIINETTPSYQVRDRGPAGGYIFHVVYDSEDQKYFYYEAAPDDLANIWLPFSNVSDQAVGDTYTTIDTGGFNTLSIVAQAGHANSAAKACLDHEVTVVTPVPGPMACAVNNDYNTISIQE